MYLSHYCYWYTPRIKGYTRNGGFSGISRLQTGSADDLVNRRGISFGPSGCQLPTSLWAGPCNISWCAATVRKWSWIDIMLWMSASPVFRPALAESSVGQTSTLLHLGARSEPDPGSNPVDNAAGRADAPLQRNCNRQATRSVAHVS